MDYTCTAHDVARYFIARGVSGDMQLQKLLYFTQAWHLAWTGHPMFADEFQAWAHGPVQPDVYRDYEHGSLKAQASLDAIPDQYDKTYAKAVYDFYGRYDGGTLASITHAELPWQEARGDTPEGASSNAIISTGSMTRFYTHQASSESPGVTIPNEPILPTRTITREEARQVGREIGREWAHTLEILAQ